MSSVVLITTANVPPKEVPFLKMTDFATRYITAKAAVFFWAAQGIKQIVIADATGEALLNEQEILLIRKMGVEVEQISYFQNENSVKLKGKGYGEGQLLKFALMNSDFLNHAKSFFKCTGKIYCRNFGEIANLIQENNIENIFWRHLDDGDPSKPWADTRFFYSSKNFCEEKIIPAYLNSDDGISAATEYNCFNILNASLPTATALRPLLSGFSGGTGKQYFDMSFGFLDYNFPCWYSTKKS